MKFISLFAGIGGFDLALQQLGHECVYANEWDKYAADTYEKNFGHRPDTRSITDVSTADIPEHDLLVGGFPCQAFSVAGKRRGFNETRGTLFFEIARIINDKRPRYFLLENVKGLLSHENGQTFQTILRVLTGLGYELQWQVLNSKNFGVPQNRERVYIVGNIREKPRPQIFPFRENASVHTTGVISTTLRAHQGGPNQSDTFVAQRVPLKFLNRNQRKIEGDYSYTIDSLNTGGVMVMKRKRNEFGKQIRKDYEAKRVNARLADIRDWQAVEQNYSNTLSGVQIDNLINTETRIRRLTPIECERLQGFPDNWTEGVSDTQRYKQLGNAVTVNTVHAVAKYFNEI